ncbi:glycosyltransferase [Glycomyces xiaoerkulensis]|uniref:glycosyltransferase n=1 Tax=Glycomyces xiaoerkulensis TaxID=2038139 RepID=UPI000C269B6D|nr:glycosyltransferase [Glycomyces xiaoerkulensis]
MAAESTPSQPIRILRDYSAISRRRDAASLSNTAIRLRSRNARELIAYDALNGRGGTAELERLGRGEDFAAVGVPFKDLLPKRLATYARTIALQQLESSDSEVALGLLERIGRTWNPGWLQPSQQALHAQLLWNRRELSRLRRLLKRYRRIDPASRAALELNLTHPDETGERDWNRWLDRLGRWMPPAEWSLTADSETIPFDRLRATAPARTADQRVTVAVTCFRPDRSLITALRSLISQSWERLEILLLDDGSGREYRELLDEAAELDDRVRLVCLESNVGTYAARNVALDMASGSLLTFQDADDWSHPDRIAMQVEALNSVPGAVATVADGIKMRADLTIDRIGRPVTGISMPSTMVRSAEVISRVGYFHNLRKSADGEYLARLEAVFGEDAIVYDPRLLQMLRQGDDSLSRSDFGAGGAVHPAREAYRSAYALWHEQVQAGAADPFIDADDPVPVPTDIHLHHNLPLQPDRAEYDYVFATDWRPYGAPAKSTLEEISALLPTGASIGVLQMDSYRYASAPVRPLCGPVQDLINRGLVGRVLSNNPTHARTLFVRYPPVLQFDLAAPPQLSADRVYVIANQAPRERDGSDVRYTSAICSANAEAWFGVPPVWVPQGVETRRALEDEGELHQDQISDVTLPSVIEPERWAMPRNRFRSDIPVIGRHSRDYYTKWPDSPESLLCAYPDAPSLDVRVMGGAEVPRRLLNGRLPLNWTAYDYNEVSVKSFLYQLDFWVYFHHPVLVESFGRATLEAMATGCVVILPHHFSATFGDGAVYCRIDQVQQTIEGMWKDFDAFREQSERGMRYVREHFSHESHLVRVRSLDEAGIGLPGQRCASIDTSSITTS